METITIYETNGKRFDKYSDAEEYEKLCERVNDIMKQLPPRTEKVEYSEDYNEHNIKILKVCFIAFLKTMKSIERFRDLIMPNDKVPFDNGIKYHAEVALFRYDDCGDYPILHDAIYRFQCIDFETGFEFSQPYYVTHQEEFFNHIKLFKNK